MPNVYTTYSLGTAITPSKSLFAIFNNVGSGKIIKIYNISCLNNQVAAITNATINLFDIQRITDCSGGTALLYVKHDSQNPNIPADISLSTGGVVVNSSTFRRIWWSGNYPISGTKTKNEWETIPNLSFIWDSSFTETVVEPIVIREGYGISLNAYQTHLTTVSTMDIFIEFTME